MRPLFKKIITFISGVVLTVVLIIFFIRTAGILNISTLSSQLTYNLLQTIFPVLLAILFIITALLFRPSSARKIPEHEPLLISDADSFLYNIPPDEPYMPQITYNPDAKASHKQNEHTTEYLRESSDFNNSDDSETGTIFGKDELSFFQGLKNIDKPAEDKKIKEEVMYPAESIDSHNTEKQTTRDLNKPNLFSIRINPAKADKQEKVVPEEVFEDTFDTRLEKENLYANEQKYDISLALVRLRYKDKNRQNIELHLYSQAIQDFLGESSYIYKYKEHAINSYALILPFSSYSEAQEELISLYRYLKDALEEDQLIFSCGFSSRFGRELESSVLLREAESSLKKALRKRSFCMLGFEPDLDNFDTNI
ncbi:MAG: hypothetical protein H8E98_02460 [Bacteroidetes bacterium]|nr:hypothetical protein [Bacteroidota bacterium]